MCKIVGRPVYFDSWKKILDYRFQTRRRDEIDLREWNSHLGCVVKFLEPSTESLILEQRDRGYSLRQESE